MDYQSAKEEAKRHLEELLQSMGKETRKTFRCLNPAHEDKHPSMSLDRKANRAKCFSCGASYDTMDVIGLEYGWTDKNGVDPAHFTEALQEACRRFNIPLDRHSFYPKGDREIIETTQQPATNTCGEEERRQKEDGTRRLIAQAQTRIGDPEAAAYLKKRGITLQTAKDYGLGYLQSFYTDSGTWRALIIPTSETSFTARNIDTDEKGKKVRKRGEAHIFNLKALEESETVHVVEGELDALSVMEAGGQAIALCSTEDKGLLVDALKRAAESPSKPLKCNTLILSLDNDAAGARATQELREGIRAINESYPSFKMRLKTINISGEHKDPNEAHTSDPEAFKQAVKLMASKGEVEAYAQVSAAARLSDFYDGVSNSVNTPAVPTGFSLLDKELDGGLYEGLYTIPAITSLGKTSFALQMADNIARQGKDVIYITLEMAESELIAKSLSRLTFEIAIRNEDIDKALCKTVRGITDGKRYERYSESELALIMRAYNEYDSYAKHLFFIEGMGDITVNEVRRAVQRHIDITGNTPVLFVDYVQILAPTDPRATDKQNMDKSALELKRISRQFKIPVVILSSLNRDNYKEEINLAGLKESGALEYGSDVVIGLQLQGAGKKRTNEWVDERMREDPRSIEARILKNRNGERGGRLYFDYYKLFNYFYEQENPNDKAIKDEEGE